MGRVPNQKHIVVNKAPCDVAHIYTMRNKESEAYASRTLGNAAYRMWTYLSSHQDGYDFDLSNAAVEKEYGIKIRQYNTGVAELIEKGFLELLDDNNNYSFVEYPVITKCNNGENGEDGSVITKCNNVNETDDENKDKNPVITKRNNDVITKCNKGVITKCNNPLLQNVIRNNTYNTYNTIDSTEFSSHDYSTKVENHFEENLSHGEKGNIDKVVHMDKVVQVLDKSEKRKIITSDGVSIELPIENILSGLKYALVNKQNESVIREIRDRCDLTDKQKSEIDEVLDFWELDF